MGKKGVHRRAGILSKMRGLLSFHRRFGVVMLGGEISLGVDRHQKKKFWRKREI